MKSGHKGLSLLSKVAFGYIPGSAFVIALLTGAGLGFAFLLAIGLAVVGAAVVSFWPWKNIGLKK